MLEITRGWPRNPPARDPGKGKNRSIHARRRRAQLGKYTAAIKAELPLFLRHPCHTGTP